MGHGDALQASCLAGFDSLGLHQILACVGELVQPAVKLTSAFLVAKVTEVDGYQGKPLHWGFESLPHAPDFQGVLSTW